MDSSIVTDSIQDAWSRTRSLLFSASNVGRWLKYGFVAMLGATAMRAAGSFGYSPPISPSGGQGGGGWSGPDSVDPNVLGHVRDAFQWLGDHFGHLLMLGLGLLVVWLVLFLVFMYIRSVFRFIFVDCVAAGQEPRIGASWHRHAGRGLSLLLWYFVIGLVPLALLIVALVPIVGSAGLIGSGEALPAVLGVAGMIAVFAAFLLAIVVLALIQALTGDLLVPAMYVQDCGVIEGWRHVMRAWRGQFWNVVLFYLLKLVLAIGAGIVAGLVGLFASLLLILPAASLTGIGGLVALSGVGVKPALTALAGPALIVIVTGWLACSYILNVLLLPVSVFFQAYSLSFVGKMDPRLRTI